MTQLILNGIYLPEQNKNRYSAHPAELRVQLTMIAGNVVSEVRGNVWQVSYSADYLSPSLWRQIAPILRSSQPITVTFLPDNADELVTDSMIVTAITNPTYAFSVRGAPAWHNVAFTLRSVRPYD